ncbi:unnamed protein product [Miscanthus lutarioriparius]|uniref:DUF4220 domain-containing protein n=1 Tax=Miscanthus lutarioriparius TaxID=422564 RepID=A0A811S656_9POAL|nr:unnamed protein product [Miscanthus lutarioriparius]
MVLFNHTNPCPLYMSSYIRNLTSSYTNKSNDSTMVSSSVIMFVLTGLFFNLNLFSGVSDVSTILNPKVRVFLSTLLSVFLPVMSYLFSEAKNTGSVSSPATRSGVADDLSLRAGMILAWMLLVELLRKKVDEIHMRGYSGTIQRAGRVVWLGNLVFFNIGSAGRKAVFSILWILCATKLVQRVAFTVVGKRSYAHGKNPRLISSYMAEMLENHHRQDDVEQAVHVGDELLKRCRFIIMGEEKLVEATTVDGYKVSKINPSNGSCIVTIGKVWEVAEEDKLFTSLDKEQHLKRICLSFALYKLLRRRFEHLPAITDEARTCRDIILKGLYSDGGSERNAEALFQVMSDEVTFLSEYYHSVVPVVLASPSFLLVNYFLLHILVMALCFMTITLCGNGDVKYAFSSIRTDNYTLRYGIPSIIFCLVSRVSYSPAAFFSIVDLCITVLLFIIFFYEEIWELFVFLLSNWFMVSLLCNYIAKPHWHESTIFSWSFPVITWLRGKMSDTNLRLKQFSVLNIRWPVNIPLFATFSFLVKAELVPSNLKESIIEYLVEHDRGAANYTPLTNGRSALQRNGLSNRLSWACDSDSVAEVILTWHIATSILEVKCAPRSRGEEVASSKVATRLSKYCAYLVAFHPELLPDYQEKAELVFEDMKKELRGMIGLREYFASLGARVDKILLDSTRAEEAGREVEVRIQREIDEEEAAGLQSDQNKVVMNGAKLGRSLMAEANNIGLETVWKVLADVWTELVVFIVPSNEEERVKGHEEALVQGEFITVLWALTTHIGISRRPTTK